ncbi:MAG TPA: S8 family serine peptidase, partial [bacterium]|nr:S8 family serine peptidase [bacterium]
MAGIRLTSLDPSTLLTAPYLRCIYKESGQPEPEDELSVLEVLLGWEETQTVTSIFDVLRDWVSNGKGTRIGIIDSGCDTNSNQDCHPDLRGRIGRYISYPGSPGFDYVGHGTHLSGILAGTGRQRTDDDDGFNLGAGFKPLCLLTVSDALLASPFPPASGYSGMIRDVALTGTRLCNNSWNDGEGTGIGYHPNCAIWDAAVRNTDPDSQYASSLPMTCVFSAGNRGPEPGTITSPKEAKNIITVGATGSIRSGEPWIPLNSSSRGPCADGRYAPTLSAPGDAIFSCWPHDAYLSQTGSSVAAAHVTGSAGLLYDWWKERLDRGPSPALMKALLALSTQPVGPFWPDPATGWGKLDLRCGQPAFASATVIDQTSLLTPDEPDGSFHVIATTPNEPLDIVLTWTDPPAAPGANPALINNLNLKVISNGSVYYGNSFLGTLSIPDGTPDTVNNIERVRLPEPGLNAEIIVEGCSIRGDGVPGNGIPADQDFALAVSGGYIVMEPPKIHCLAPRVSGNQRVEILATCANAAPGTTFPIRITSLDNPEGIIVELPEKEPSGSGCFQGCFYTGMRHRPDEISVLPADILQISPLCCPETGGISILADGSAPSITRVAFEDIFARSTTFNVQTTDVCDLNVFFRELGAPGWDSYPSEFQQQNHRVELANLVPRTSYEMFISLHDLVGNAYNSLDHFPILRWDTSQSIIHYAQYMNTDPEFEILDGLWEWGIPSGNGI